MCRPIVPHLISRGLPDEPEDPGRGDEEEDEDDDEDRGHQQGCSQNIATSRGALSSWRPSPPAVTVLASRPKEAQPTSIQRRGETAASRKKRRGRKREVVAAFGL